MAVTENDLIRGPFTPDNGVDTISLDFYVEDAGWLEVYKSGSESPLVLDVDYTFAGEGTSSGVVTLTTPANGTDAYSVYLSVPLERVSDFQFRGGFRSGPVNIELDRIWQALQNIKTIAQRTVFLSRTSPLLPPLTFREDEDTNNRAIVFDETSEALIPGPTVDEIEGATASAQEAADSAQEAALYEGPWLDDVSALIADTALTYTSGQPGTVAAGDIIRTRAEGFSYEVAASGATDHHVTTAGGVKLRAVPNNNIYSMLALNPNADGITNDKAKIDLLNVSGYVLDLGGNDYEYGGVWTAAATVINGRIIDDNRTFDYRQNTPETKIISPQNRWRCNYFTGTRLQIFGGGQVMLGGMRMFGNYYKQGRFIATGVNGFTDVDAADGQDLGVETTRALENWYAAFACANRSDAACQFKLMPYLRAASVAGSVVTLGQAGERKHVPLTARTYAWADDALNGVECLVITENGQWSGRVTTITDCTNGSITLADVTGVVAGDFLLPAPPGFTEYAWLVDHYMDTSEWRNIADAGYDVGALMVNHATFPATLEVATITEYSLAGYISPLATAAILKINLTLSNTGTGDFSQRIWHDTSLHEVWSSYEKKPPDAWQTVTVTDSAGHTVDVVRPIAGDWPIQHSGIKIPFSKKQSIFYITSGSMDNTVISRTLGIRGWIVP